MSVTLARPTSRHLAPAPVTCARCGGQLRRTYYDLGTWREPLPVCADCVDWSADYGTEFTIWMCRICGTARAQWDRRVRGYCSPECAQMARLARRRHAYSARATTSGPTICNTCRRPISGRADARYCSPACRQAAYRARRAS